MLVKPAPQSAGITYLLVAALLFSTIVCAALFVLDERGSAGWFLLMMLSEIAFAAVTRLRRVRLQLRLVTRRLAPAPSTSKEGTIKMDTHEHTTFGEQGIFLFASIAKAICALVIVWVFFTPEFLPACAPGTIVKASPLVIYLAMAMLALTAGLLGAYASNWTPNVGKYEGLDALMSLIYAVPLAYGVYRNWTSLTDIMTFAAGIFGLLAFWSLLLDWIGRWVKIRAARKAARTPTTT